MHGSLQTVYCVKKPLCAILKAGDENMQIDRLFQMVYLLLSREKMTAKELAERFEVSERTIYRDVDTLSGAGIPIFATKGKGGGIGLMPDFVLNKSVLSEQEQNEILFSLQGLSATNGIQSDAVLKKLGSLFQKEERNWIDVDFSQWGSGEEERLKFQTLKDGILKQKTVAFTYYSAYGERSERTVEPSKLRFKNNSWYLQGYCLQKQAFRTFKIARMQHVCLTDRSCEVRTYSDIPLDPYCVDTRTMVHIKLWFSSQAAYRLYDNFDQSQIVRNEDGSFLVDVWYPEDGWVYGFLLSFGEDVRVISPIHIQNILKEKAKKILEQYS